MSQGDRRGVPPTGDFCTLRLMDQAEGESNRPKGTFQATYCGIALCCTCVRSSWFLTLSPGQELSSDTWCPPWLCC